MRRILEELGEWIYSLVVAFAAALLINIFVFQPSLVMGPSMEPTLHEGERIFLSKISLTLGKLPDYGEIVIIDSRVLRERTWQDKLTEPMNNWITILTGRQPGHEVWVKRVIGRPGDVLEFRDGFVIRNGQPLQEFYTKEKMKYETNKKVEVPAGHVFVMGDNRNNSSDSRMIGSIPASHIMGIMFFGL